MTLPENSHTVRAEIHDLNGNSIRPGQPLPVLRRTASGRLFIPDQKRISLGEVVGPKIEEPRLPELRPILKVTNEEPRRLVPPIVPLQKDEDKTVVFSSGPACKTMIDDGSPLMLKRSRGALTGRAVDSGEEASDEQNADGMIEVQCALPVSDSSIKTVIEHKIAKILHSQQNLFLTSHSQSIPSLASGRSTLKGGDRTSIVSDSSTIRDTEALWVKEGRENSVEPYKENVTNVRHLHFW